MPVELIALTPYLQSIANRKSLEHVLDISVELFQLSLAIGVLHFMRVPGGNGLHYKA